MDSNKLQKLKEIGYELQKSCTLCTHSIFHGGKDLGACKRFTYKHLKHTDSKRDLSIHRSGMCNGMDDARIWILH